MPFSTYVCAYINALTTLMKLGYKNKQTDANNVTLTTSACIAKTNTENLHFS